MIKRKNKLVDEMSSDDFLGENETPSFNDLTKDNVVVNNTEKVEFTQHAIGMYKAPDKNTNKYILVKIEYDPVTKVAGKVEEIYKDIREDCIDKFKFMVDELNFFGGRD